MDVVATEALDDGFEKQELEAAPVDRVLGIGEPCLGATKIRGDDVAILGAVLDRTSAETGGAQRGSETQFVQRLGAVGQQVDSDAERLDLVDGLVDLDVPALPVEGQRRGQPSDTRTDDDRSHG